MIGFRGASRYVDPSFADAFALECRAMKKVRDEMGLTNVWVMIPFVRTLGEGRKVIEVLAKNGLKQRRERPQDHHDVRGAVERPARRRIPRHLRRLLDRLERPDAADARPRPRFRHRRAACSTSAIRRSRSCCRWRSRPRRAKGKYIGICGQGPSDHPDLAEWLMEQGIESVSLNPDTVVDTWLRLAKKKAG